MENASKALLIAGGMLIAILIIALLVNSYTSISSFQQTKLSEEEQEKLIIFNERYTKYLGKYVYGTEVASLKNKYENDKLVKVLPEGLNVPSGVGQDTKYFKCTAIGYDELTGKVNSITFEEIILNSEE